MVLRRILGARAGSEAAITDGGLLTVASYYGNLLTQSIPNGDCFCSLCSAKKNKTAVRSSCCLCSAKGGAMKRMTKGQNLRSINNLRSTINQ
jgi:hypothetical protein